MYNSLRRGLGFTPTKKIENLDKIYLTGNLSIENKEKIKKIKKSAKNIFNSNFTNKKRKNIVIKSAENQILEITKKHDNNRKNKV